VCEAHAIVRYCKGSSDAQLLKWWAQYCESQGKFDQALAVYVQGNDVASQVPRSPLAHCFDRVVIRFHFGMQVKVLSCQGDIDAAKKLAVDTGNALACFHVAKQLEYAEQVQPRACLAC
jgi:hypothetical protein